MTPVDYISRAIVHLAARKDSFGKIFHLANSRRVQLGKVADWMRTFGYPLRRVPYDSWVAELLTRRGSVSRRRRVVAGSPVLPEHHRRGVQRHEIAARLRLPEHALGPC